MLGYWNRDDEIVKVMMLNGYFKMGDIGVCLVFGVIKIVDCFKDMIIVLGFNVYFNEIEDVLIFYLDIMEVVVVG